MYTAGPRPAHSQSTPGPAKGSPLALCCHCQRKAVVWQKTAISSLCGKCRWCQFCLFPSDGDFGLLFDLCLLTLCLFDPLSASVPNNSPPNPRACQWELSLQDRAVRGGGAVPRLGLGPLLALMANGFVAAAGRWGGRGSLIWGTRSRTLGVLGHCPASCPGWGLPFTVGSEVNGLKQNVSLPKFHFPHPVTESSCFYLIILHF